MMFSHLLLPPLLAWLPCQEAAKPAQPDPSSPIETVPTEPDYAKEKKRIRAGILEISKDPAQAVPRLLAMFMGKADPKLGVMRDEGGWWRRRISWWAFGELMLHEMPSDQWEPIDRRIQVLRLPGQMDPEPIRPSMFVKVWTKERAEALFDGLAKASDDDKAALILEIFAFRFLGLLPKELRGKIREQAVVLLASKDLRLRRLGMRICLNSYRSIRREHVKNREAVKKAWEDHDPEMRYLAWSTGFMHRIEHRSCKRSVRKALESANPAIRDAATRALLEHGHPEKRDVDELTPLLLSSLQSEDLSRVFRALDALSNLPFGSANPSPDAWSGLLAPLARHGNAGIRAKLPRLLLHRLPATPASWRLIFQLMTDQDPGVVLESVPILMEFEITPERMAGVYTRVQDIPLLPKAEAFRRILEICARSSEGLTEKDAEQLLQWATEDKTKHPAHALVYLAMANHAVSLSEKAIDDLRVLSECSTPIKLAALLGLSLHTNLTANDRKALTRLSRSRSSDAKAIACLALAFDALRTDRKDQACALLGQFLDSGVISKYWLALPAGMPFADRLARDPSVWKACSAKLFQLGVMARSNALSRGFQWYRWQRLADGLALLQRGQKD